MFVYLTRCIRIHDLEAQGLYSNPIQFYDFMQNRVMIVFRPKFEEISDENKELQVVLSKKHTYDVVSLANGFLELSQGC